MREERQREWYCMKVDEVMGVGPDQESMFATGRISVTIIDI